jgi:cytochrome P450
MVAINPNRPPGPKGLPLIGEALRFQKDPFGFFLWLRDSFGDIVEDKSSPITWVTIYSPAAIEHVLVRAAKNYKKDRILKSWTLLFGEGLLTSEGDHWKRDRNAIQPTFSRVRLESYFPSMHQHALKTADLLKKSEAEPVDIGEAMNALTLNIALEALFGSGKDSDFLPSHYQTVQKALTEITDWFEFSSGAWAVLPQLFPRFPFPKKIRYQKSVAKLDVLMGKIIEKKRKSISDSSTSQDLLGALIAASDPGLGAQASYTNQQVRDHALTFFLAGHETTSLALTYILRLLAIHTDIQEQLRQALADCPDLDSCELLDQVIDEALRLFPPAAVTARESIEPDEIQGYAIAPGSTIGIPIWAIHRDARYYGDDVEVFRPSRWTAEFRKKLPRSMYLPFGFGPRICVGFRFAQQEMKIILQSLLAVFRIRINPEHIAIQLRLSITMRPKDPVMLSFETIRK